MINIDSNESISTKWVRSLPIEQAILSANVQRKNRLQPIKTGGK